ncbi:MAG: hypothetical protein V7782_03085 [Psychromonas sp.]
MTYPKTIIAISLATLLSACGSSDDSNPVTPTAKLTLGVANTNASEAMALSNTKKDYSNVDQVSIAFTYVYLKKQGDSDDSDEVEHHLTFEDDEGNSVETRQVHLRDITDEDTSYIDAHYLFPEIDVAPGKYQVCVYMHTNPNDDNAAEDLSYLIENDENLTVKGLTTPSQGACAGAKPPTSNYDTGRIVVKDLEVLEGDNFIAIDFGLKHTLKHNQGQDEWSLKPQGYSFFHVSGEGRISGEIDNETVRKMCPKITEDEINIEAVYLYPRDTDILNMGDVREEQHVDKVAPLATTEVAVTLNADGSEQLAAYHFDNVTNGYYTVGYTCQAHLDDPIDADDSFEIYQASENLRVFPSATTEYNF